ncbi:hypothetical protein ACIQXM_13495 [Arthrobacter sp. NPDC097144]|uniref:hypothetical protein n=1 Tax=Arthrobacter sp. NPDC097144 TaxID=3363946 RepID=UPI0037F20C76
MSHAVMLAGGSSTMLIRSVPMGKPFWLEFSDCDIPVGARVYKVVNGPIGDPDSPGGVTVMAHATQTVGGQLDPKGIQLFPIVLGADAPGASEADVLTSFFVVWAPPADPDNIPQRLMLSAFAAYGEDDMTRSVIDADAAVEFSLRRLVTADFMPNWNYGVEKRMKLQTRLLLLTTALVAKGQDPIPDEVIGLLFKLNSMRNDAAHGASQKNDPLQIAELITNALVAVSQFHRWFGEVSEPMPFTTPQLRDTSTTR